MSCIYFSFSLKLSSLDKKRNKVNTILTNNKIKEKENQFSHAFFTNEHFYCQYRKKQQSRGQLIINTQIYPMKSDCLQVYQHLSTELSTMTRKQRMKIFFQKLSHIKK